MLVVDCLARHLGAIWHFNSRSIGHLAVMNVDNQEIILLKPTVAMNINGRSIARTGIIWYCQMILIKITFCISFPWHHIYFCKKIHFNLMMSQKGKKLGNKSLIINEKKIKLEREVTDLWIEQVGDSFLYVWKISSLCWYLHIYSKWIAVATVVAKFKVDRRGKGCWGRGEGAGGLTKADSGC